MSNHKQLNATRGDAQHSAASAEQVSEASSFNRFKHGLSGRFAMIPGESAQDFNQLLTWLLEEHTPENTEETVLVSKMAEHFWLSQRAQSLQSQTFNEAEYEAVYGGLTRQERDRQFVVYMTSASNHERAFQWCLAKLAKLRALKAKETLRLEHSKIEQAREKRIQEVHELKMVTAKRAEMETEAFESNASRPFWRNGSCKPV